MVAENLFLVTQFSFIDDFEEWLDETMIWQYLTDLDKKKQGSAIYLFHVDEITKTCSNIKVKYLNSDVDILMDTLESLFAKDLNQGALIAYSKLEMFTRPSYMDMVDFIDEFERLFKKLKK